MGNPSHQLLGEYISVFYVGLLNIIKGERYQIHSITYLRK
jgi:hypothetical protein